MYPYGYTVTLKYPYGDYFIRPKYIYLGTWTLRVKVL